MMALREDDGNNFSKLASMQGDVFLGHFTSPPFIATPPQPPFHSGLERTGDAGLPT